MSNLILCGPKGAGKTTFGKKLAELLGRPFFDTDQMFGDSKKLYLELGEKNFRELEKSTLQKLKRVESSIIALGGGALLLPENRKYLRQRGTIIYIHVDKKSWLKRVEMVDSPIFTPSKEAYYQLRVEICRKAAHIEINYGI
ncbi:MAG: shikimate kinase [Candidatus Algichlamydia australiensis]|nr:shikimate kinase [Chlamydiales bacterium]